MEEVTASDIEKLVDELVDRYRAECLWFLRADYRPTTDEERLRLLDSIQKHGDRAAFIRAGEARRWLLHRSRERSAGS